MRSISNKKLLGTIILGVEDVIISKIKLFSWSLQSSDKARQIGN